MRLHRPNFPYRLVVRNACSETMGFFGWTWTMRALILPSALLIGLLIYWRVRGLEATVEEAIVAIAFVIAPLGILSLGLFLWNLFFGFFVGKPPTQVIKPTAIVWPMPNRTEPQRIRYLFNRFWGKIARIWRESKRGF